ncbi:hypothetical protein GIB67_003889 [Kingdonia uniflora]|uniref:SWIM-type domain-containing protein n=1 Tax=Kingdonia uniflora TaxID=39325 RepID=A0A7J7LJY7_9MAGN|nr:hypothetical protein GIB67_003889 [Kingdonia uniflora]
MDEDNVDGGGYDDDMGGDDANVGGDNDDEGGHDVDMGWDNEDIERQVNEWIHFSQLNIDSLDAEEGYYSNHSSQDGDVIPNEEDLRRYGKKWKVNLEERTCDCNEWRVTGLPCVHAYCVISHMRLNWVGYCSEYHMVSSYVKTFSGSVLAISDPSLWDKTVNIEVLPPPLEREAGRPRKVRRKGDDEGGSQQKRCHKCGHLGHNLKTCKGPPAKLRPRGLQSTTRVRGGRGITEAGRGKTAVVRSGRGIESLSQEPIIPTQGSQTSKEPPNNPYKKLFRPPREIWLI